jgi:hypothetical protein
MNGIELFNEIKVFSTFRELLSKTNNDSERGRKFEIVSNIILRLGFCPLFQNDSYSHYEGNIETGKLTEVTNIKNYLANLKATKGGPSDITLCNKHTEEYVFISCKFYNDDSNKYIADYDIQEIRSAILGKQHKYKIYKIYLFVNDKEKVLKVVSSCEDTNKTKKDEVLNNIIDINDLEIYFKLLKDYIIDINIDNIDHRFSMNKTHLELRFHQNLLIHKMINKIEAGNKDILLGAKARSGKTYCIGGLFIKYYKKYNTLNALIVTPAPNETMSQFTDDLFNKFIDFNDIQINEIKKGTDFNHIQLSDKNIIIVSKQLLDDYVLDNKIKKIQNLNLDLIVFDENHFHGTTEMSKNIFQSYSSLNTVKLYLTATYAKPLREWNILDECQFYWDIEDEQLCKRRNIRKLVEKHGNEVLLFLDDINVEEKLKIYDKMPDLHIITNMMDSKRYEIIKERIKDTNYGFSNSALLSINNNGNNFNYIEEVDNILKYISGKGSIDEIDDPIRDTKSIFERIKKISNDTNTRTKLNNGDFTTQLWFLPFGKNMLIDKVSKCLKERMLKNRVLSKYEIMIINSKKEFKLKDIKEEIKNKELKAKTEGKSGLILLAGNQLTLGVTLPFVDIVLLLNDVLSCDRIFQMMYRCMTETIQNKEHNLINNGIKKIGFVVDLNISRVINTIIDYNIHNKDLNIEKKIQYLIENNLINIDSDLFYTKENKSKLVERLLDIWKCDPINNLKKLLQKIEDNIIELETRDQKEINNYFTSSINHKNFNLKVKFDEDSKEPLNTGTNVTKKEKEECGEKEKDDEKEAEINISLTKDVLPFIIPLSCILTIKDNNYDFIEILNTIKNDNSLLEVFNHQSYIWWNNEDIINLINQLLQKYVKKNSYIYDIAIQFKMSLQSLIDKPTELLELIDSCLKPKQKEKQENGEVFTPMNLVFEMLDKLDNYYKCKNGHSIFTEKDFKWFDPATGMGNFPVAVYLRLMDGLKEQIHDNEARKKHIIENMLYMSEINKKNVYICKQIFDINNQYKLNIYEGDTLLLDIQKKWKIAHNSFNVILGNPPYNKGGIRSHTGKQLGEKNETIWTKFIENTFSEWLIPDGFLVFINPLSWLKKSHSLHIQMLEKQIVWLKLWDNIKSLATINGKIPISLYILQNTLNSTNQKTEIISEIQSKKLTTTSSEYLNPNYSIPLSYHSIFNKLIDFIETRNLQLEYKTKTIKSSGTKTKIPASYSLENNLAVDTYTIKDGLMVKKSIEQHPDANKRKLIISNKASFTGAFIDEGKLGLTGNDKSYILGDNLELLLKLLSFKISDMISHFTKYRQDFLEKEVYTYLPDIRKLGISDISEGEFYKLLKLTTLEIKSLNYTDDIIDYSIVDNEKIFEQQIEEHKSTANHSVTLDTVSNISNKSKSTYTVEIIKNMCKDRNIKGISNKKKSELAEKLLEYHNDLNRQASSSYIALSEKELEELNKIITK